MRRLATAVLLMVNLLVSACADSATSPRPTQNTTPITGTVVEKLDAPPYSYLRIETDKGAVWAAVPITSIDASKPVTSAASHTTTRC